jgi:hypothetical protein
MTWPNRRPPVLRCQRRKSPVADSSGERLKEALQNAIAIVPASFQRSVRERVPWMRPETTLTCSNACARLAGGSALLIRAHQPVNSLPRRRRGLRDALERLKELHRELFVPDILRRGADPEVRVGSRAVKLRVSICYPNCPR